MGYHGKPRLLPLEGTEIGLAVSHGIIRRDFQKTALAILMTFHP